MTPWPLTLLLALACGDPTPTAQPDPEPDDTPAERQGERTKSERTKAERSGRELTAEERRERRAERERLRKVQVTDDVPLILFVVLDTVRSHNLSMCGYERPTTPYLDKLASRSLVSHSCQAYAPGTWTVPSHASYFTGQTVPEHGTSSAGLTLPDKAPVMSEVLAERGYRTAFVAANPTMSAKSGLDRGFEIKRIGKNLIDMRGDDVARNVDDVLSKVGKDESLFLFVNILDAHDPYPRVPDGVDWLDPQPRIELKATARDKDQKYHDYLRGDLPPREAEAYVDEIRDGYDYGIYLADQALEEVMRTLRKDGRLDRGYRIVITSDHGEFLGEHGLLRHGCFTWEPVTRVPFLFFDSRREEPLALPDPFPARHAYSLVVDGALPEELEPPRSFSKKRSADPRVCADMVALWPDTQEKLVFQDGKQFLIDLGDDPGENDPLALPDDHPMRPLLRREARAHMQHVEESKRVRRDDEWLEELHELGYME